MQSRTYESIYFVCTVGVATSIVLRDQVWAPRSLPQQYAVADYLEESVPDMDKASKLLEQAQNVDVGLSDEFIYHLYACVLYVYRAYIEETRLKKLRHRRSNSGGGNDSTAPGPINGGSGTNSNSSMNPSNVSNGSASGSPAGTVAQRYFAQYSCCF